MVEPREEWLAPEWAHYRQGDDAPISVGPRELVVELVHPRLPLGGVLFITFTYRDLSGEGAWTWMPTRWTVIDPGFEAYAPLPPGDRFGAGLDQLPMMHLIRSARAYAGMQPRDREGTPALVETIERIREIRGDGASRVRLERFRDDFIEAHRLAQAIAPHRATAYLADLLGVGTATIRRWIAATTAAQGSQEGGAE